MCAEVDNNLIQECLTLLPVFCWTALGTIESITRVTECFGIWQCMSRADRLLQINEDKDGEQC